MKRIEFNGITHEFPDDFTDADIAAALGDSAAPAEATRTATPPSDFSQPLSEWSLDALQAALPTILMMATTKGLGTLPGMVLRGGAGAGLGEAGKMGMEAVRGQGAPGWQEALLRLSGAGGAGMGGTALGGMAGALIPTSQAGAVSAYQRALRPSKEVITSFPGVVERGLQRKIPVSPKGRGQALTEVRRAAQEARSLRQGAQQAGMTMGPRDLAGSAIKAAMDAKGGPLTAQELARVLIGVRQSGQEYLQTASAGALRPPATPKPSKLLDQYGRPRPAPPRPKTRWTPAMVNAIRRQAGTKADPTIRSAERGKIKASNVEAGTMEAGAREALGRIPGHQAAQQELQGAMGLNRAMIDAMSRNQSAWPMTLRTQQFPWSPQLRPDFASELAAFTYNLPPFVQQALRQMVLRGPQATAGGVQALFDQPALPDTLEAP